MTNPVYAATFLKHQVFEEAVYAGGQKLERYIKGEWYKVHTPAANVQQLIADLVAISNDLGNQTNDFGWNSAQGQVNMPGVRQVATTTLNVYAQRYIGWLQAGGHY